MCKSTQIFQALDSRPLGSFVPLLLTVVPGNPCPCRVPGSLHRDRSHNNGSIRMTPALAEHSFLTWSLPPTWGHAMMVVPPYPPPRQTSWDGKAIGAEEIRAGINHGNLPANLGTRVPGGSLYAVWMLKEE